MFLKTNARIRTAEYRPLLPLKLAILGRDLRVGLAYQDANIKVTAVENSHYTLPKGAAGGAKSYSYRFETPDKVIVFTGDTGPSKAVTDLAQGADILVSEMVSQADIAHVPPDVVQHMLHEHLDPEQLGKLAQAAGVKQVVISHTRSATEADRAEIRKYYSGPVVIGSDLDRF
jgi:ribonuclease BN (tRNA processing enzyme)